MNSSNQSNQLQLHVVRGGLEDEVAHTRSGRPFRPSDDVWDVVDGVYRLRLDFQSIAKPFLPFKAALKACLAVYVQGYSAYYATNLFYTFQHFVATRDASLPFRGFTAQEVGNYGARLSPGEQWRVGVLTVLLLKWSALGLPGVEADCTDYLLERRNPGNDKGAAVRTRDPVKGPFSESEYVALYRAVDAAYGTGEIRAWTAILTRLLFACGGRISQYASLKLLDVTTQAGKVVLRLPQVKNGEAHARVYFRDFDLSPQTGRFVLDFVEQRMSEGFDLSSPLFYEYDVMTSGPREQRRSEDDEFYGHCLATSLSKAFVAALQPILPTTERLNHAPLPVSTRRFRYTFGTRLAEEGASRAVIADRLNHADLQNVEVYFEASPKIVDNIDRAMGAMLAPIARLFRGRLVAGEEDSTLKGEAGSRIIDFRVSTQGLGSCASAGRACSFLKPVACYKCFKFEPWLDAPHAKVLERLESEREGLSDDARIAGVNDDAIEAVKEVMAEVEAVYQQRGDGAGK